MTLSLSDFFPLGASIALPSSYKRSELKNHRIDMYRNTTTGGGGGGDPNECYSVDCDGPSPDGSPLLIDLAQNGIHLGEAGVAVLFDIDNTGEPQNYQWVKPGGDEAFVVRDLNGNGLIDDGAELFGTGTAMVPNSNTCKSVDVTNAPNGFVALAQYDQPVLGGNDDGFITEQDALWHQLQLWRDSNANGLTEPGELFSLKRCSYHPS